MGTEKLDRRVRKTRRQLREGLAHLLEEKSIRDIKVKELVEEVDINRSTFYLHYSDIYDMLKQIEEELFQEIQEAIKNHPISADARSQAFIRQLFQIMDDNRAICKALCGPNGDMAFVSRMEDVVGSEAVQVIEPLFKIEKKQLRYSYAYCLNGCVGLIKMWLLNDGKETPEQMADIMYHMVSNSLNGDLDTGASVTRP